MRRPVTEITRNPGRLEVTLCAYSNFVQFMRICWETEAVFALLFLRTCDKLKLSVEAEGNRTGKDE